MGRTAVVYFSVAIACSAGPEQRPDGPGAGVAGAAGTGNGGAGTSTIPPIGTSGSNTPDLATPDASGSFDPGSAAFDCPTSLSGEVFDPSGRLPLYNVVVYVPSEPLASISEGASCQTCDGNFSGHPIVAALSDAAGKFTLKLDKVPRTANLPLVIQVGKWRRQLSIPSIAACKDNTAVRGTVRFARTKAEGNIPHIAVVRGGSDALECLFRKIGIADSEFTTDTGDGRVHLYASSDGTATTGTSHLASGPALPTAGSLYASLDKLMTYDSLFLACEGGGKGTFSKYGVPEFTNVRTYADRGGRIFGSHYHNYWVRSDAFNIALPPYPAVAKFASSQHGFDVDVTGDVDVSFPKGVAFRDWLTNVGASAAPGKLLIRGGEHTVDAAIPGVSQPWITVSPDPDGHSVVQYLSFNTPVGQAECGRMVFSDLHVASGTGDSGKIAFPTGCTSSELSPQEKALAFMLFDLTSCVQADSKPVVPPRID